MQYLVDLDRTLLDTDEYTRMLWQHVKDYVDTSVDIQREFGRVRGHYVTLGGHGTYSFENHLREVLGKQASVKAALAVLDKHFINAEECLYPYAKEALDYLASGGEVSILTFGLEAYQQAKLRRLPSLHDVPATIIQQDKSVYIQSHFEGEVTLIDDKEHAMTRKNHTHVLVDHNNTSSAINKSKPVIHGWHQIKELL